MWEIDENGKLIVPEGVTEIPYSAFYDNKRLKEVVLPSTLKSIGSYAFGRTNIEYIDIPDSVEEIGNNAFDHCEYLKEIRIPKGVTIIKCSLFCFCYNLCKVILHNNVTEIGKLAFAFCNSLKKIEVDGVLCHSSVLPSNLKTIDSYAFTSFSMHSIIIFGAVINQVAFADCKIKNIIISSGKTRCNSDAFVAADATVYILNTVDIDIDIARNTVVRYSPKLNLPYWNAKTHYLCEASTKQWIINMFLIINRLKNDETIPLPYLPPEIWFTILELFYI
jgi:hypothetical protein